MLCVYRDIGLVKVGLRSVSRVCTIPDQALLCGMTEGRPSAQPAVGSAYVD